MNDAPVSELLRQATIKTENHLMAFSDSSWQYFSDTGISSGEYILFIKAGQSTMSHMFQDQLLNQAQKLITM